MSGAQSDIVVVGAGVMGVWTAYLAQRSGHKVTLLDAYGVGHPRATSGDESRITRAVHGRDELYTRWSRESLVQWKGLGKESGTALFEPCGMLWFASREDGFEADSVAVLEAVGAPCERLSADELRHRWPQLGTEGGLNFALYEPEAGVLRARTGCQAAAAELERCGGRIETGAVRPGQSQGDRLLEVRDAAGRTWSAESFVFACGPWLPRLFPEVLSGVIRVTKQDVVFVGPPAGDRRFATRELPAWADYDAAYYGVPALDERGFKLAPDRLGPLFDPSNGDRVVDPESIRLARRYLRHRFPDLADAPVVDTRVCQYESTVNGDFLIARHPTLANAWLVGGGSGHGYKHGPQIGRYVLSRLAEVGGDAAEMAEEPRFGIGPRAAALAARTGGDEMARTWDLF